jgi:hypothetical protein
MADAMASLPPIEPAEKDNSEKARRWRFQFSLGSLMLFVLFVAIVLTSVLMYRRMSLAEEELVKLRRIAGYYKVEDKHLLYAAAIETNDPLSWGWRVYLPAGHKYTWHCYSGDIPPVGLLPKDSGTVEVGPARADAAEEIVYLSLRKNLRDQWVLSLLRESDESKVSTYQEVTDELVDRLRNARGAFWERLGNGRYESRELDGSVMFLKHNIAEKQPSGGSTSPPDKPTRGIMLWLEATQ